jgi:hypothetical protein
MKKVSLLVLLAILASTLLMAAIPTTIVRLTIINKSGYDVYMKLEGSAVTQGFYYLTVPAGDRDVPVVKVFTIMSDLYTRTTWQCNGAKSTGTLIVDGNLRLTFTPCGEKACGFAGGYDFWKNCNVRLDYVAFLAGQKLANPNWTQEDLIAWAAYFKANYKDQSLGLASWFHYSFSHRYAGEPRMEKITYFKYLTVGGPEWANAYLYTGFWNFGCGTWYYRIRTYRLPYGCAWQYQY